MGVLILSSCGGDDEGSSAEFNGNYYGMVFDTYPVGNYTMAVSNGEVSGSYSDGFETINFNSSIDNIGNSNITLDYGDGYTVDALIVILSQSKEVGGSWTDSEGSSGSISGTGTHSTFDGSYSGTASVDNVEIGDFNVTISQGKITGTYNEDGESTSMNGFVKASGAVSLNIFFDDGVIAYITGTASGTNISGNFGNSDGVSGTFTATKN